MKFAFGVSLMLTLNKEVNLLVDLDQVSIKKIAHVDDAVKLTRELLSAKDAFEQEKEHLYVIGLDPDRNVHYVDLVAVGTLDHCLMHPREVFRRAVNLMANSIILVHNHPSQNVNPSEADLKATFGCATAGMVLGIKLDASLVISMKTAEFAEIPEQHPQKFRIRTPRGPS